jgi:hypothetical protein
MHGSHMSHPQGQEPERQNDQSGLLNVVGLLQQGGELVHLFGRVKASTLVEIGQKLTLLTHAWRGVH